MKLPIIIVCEINTRIKIFPLPLPHQSIHPSYVRVLCHRRYSKTVVNCLLCVLTAFDVFIANVAFPCQIILNTFQILVFWPQNHKSFILTTVNLCQCSHWTSNAFGKFRNLLPIYWLFGIWKTGVQTCWRRRNVFLFLPFLFLFCFSFLSHLTYDILSVLWLRKVKKNNGC